MPQKHRFKSFDYLDRFSIGVVVASAVIFGYMVLMLITTRGGQRVGGNAADYVLIALDAVSDSIVPSSMSRCRS